LTDKDLMLI